MPVIRVSLYQLVQILERIDEADIVLVLKRLEDHELIPYLVRHHNATLLGWLRVGFGLFLSLVFLSVEVPV